MTDSRVYRSTDGDWCRPSRGEDNRSKRLEDSRGCVPSSRCGREKPRGLRSDGYFVWAVGVFCTGKRYFIHKWFQRLPSELGSCVKVEVAVLGCICGRKATPKLGVKVVVAVLDSPSLTVVVST